MKIFLLILVGFIVSCQENKRKDDHLVKNETKNSLFDEFQTQLTSLNIHYKYCNAEFLDASDIDPYQLCYFNNNLIITPRSLLAIGLDSNRRTKGFSLNKLYNGLTVVGFSSGAEGHSFLSFYLYDTNGKLVKELFDLKCGGDMGFMTDEYAVCKNDTFSIHKMFLSPLQEDRCNFEYVNYNIYFDDENHIHTDTIKDECYKNLSSNIKPNIKKFYMTKKKYKQRIIEDDYEQSKKGFSF